MNEFFDFLKGWWGLIMALTVYALCGAWWGGRIQKDVDNLKAGKFVSNESCNERQNAIKSTSDIQFAAGNVQFKEIKDTIAENHRELLRHILEIKSK